MAREIMQGIENGLLPANTIAGGENGVRIRRQKDRLLLESLPDGVTYDLHPESGTRFFSEEQEETFDFIEDADGRVNALMVASQWKREKIK